MKRSDQGDEGMKLVGDDGMVIILGTKTGGWGILREVPQALMASMPETRHHTQVKEVTQLVAVTEGICSAKTGLLRKQWVRPRMWLN